MPPDHEHTDLAVGIAKVSERLDRWLPEIELSLRAWRLFGTVEAKWDERWITIAKAQEAAGHERESLGLRLAMIEHRCLNCDPEALRENHRNHLEDHRIAGVRAEALLTKRAFATAVAGVGGVAGVIAGVVSRLG